MIMDFATDVGKQIASLLIGAWYVPVVLGTIVLILSGPHSAMSLLWTYLLLVVATGSLTVVIERYDP